jgi:hypothetical protein
MPLSLHDVGPVDARGGHPDQDLAISRLRNRTACDTQLLGASRGSDFDDHHVHLLFLVGTIRAGV